jgi:protocatechuate 3,4-dioxygenase beta subunit
MGLAAVAASAFGAAHTEAEAQQAGRCVLTPEAGEGPYYLDPKLVRSDITSGQPGAPLQLALQVVRSGDCATLANARVDLWHADAVGLYSGYEQQSGVGGVSTAAAAKQTYLRGTQFTDKGGNVEFRTIFPSWYGGRTPHVHFKVFLGGNEVIASQIFFPEEINKEVFAQWDPYKQHASKRTTFNDTDRIRQGVYSIVKRQNRTYAATAVLVVSQR